MTMLMKALATACMTVGIVFAGNVTIAHAAVTKPDPIGPITVYQSPVTNPSGDFINGKTYGAISPRVIQLKHQSDPKNNGKLLLTYEQEITNTEAKVGKHPVFPIYESDDNGATWKHLSDVSETEYEGWGKMNGPQLYELPEKIGNMPTGTVVLAGVSDTNDLKSKSYLELSKSTDAGQNWQYQSTIATGNGSILNEDPIWEPFLLVNNHKLICYYSDERDNYVPKSQDLVHQSTVDGVNWGEVVKDTKFSTPASAAVKENVDRPGMPILAQLPSGKWAMTYEAHGGASTGVRISATTDPEKWDAQDRGHTMANRSGGPFIATLNDGRLVFNASMYNGDGKVYAFDKESELTSDKGIAAASSSYNTKTGTAYFRDLVPLANGMLLIANGGRPQPSKSNSIRVETIDAGDSIETGQVKVHYVDESGKTIQSDYSYSGTVGTAFNVTSEANAQISGYHLKGITAGQDKLTGNIGADPIGITVTYTSNSSTTNSGSSMAATPSANSSSDTTNGSSTSTTFSSNSSTSNGQQGSSASTTNDGSTNIINQDKEMSPFLVDVKRSLYRYRNADFSIKSRIAKLTKGKYVKVVAISQSSNNNKRYKLSDGSYITANSKYTGRRYLAKKYKHLYVINKKGIYQYKSTKLNAKSQNKALKKGSLLKIKKFVKNGLTTRYQLTNGNYVTGNVQFVSPYH